MLPEYADYCYGRNQHARHHSHACWECWVRIKYGSKVEFITETWNSPAPVPAELNAVFPRTMVFAAHFIAECTERYSRAGHSCPTFSKVNRRWHSGIFPIGGIRSQPTGWILADG